MKVGMKLGQVNGFRRGSVMVQFSPDLFRIG